MKKVTFLFLLTIGVLSVSCSAQAKEQKSNNKTESVIMEKKKSEKVVHLTKKEFLSKVFDYESNPQEWKYLGDKPAIVDFYASWCGPCKTIAPILEELAEEYDGQIYIYKVDTDKERDLASAFSIRSIPALLFIPMEGQPEMAQGALPKATFKEAIESVLLKGGD